MYFFKTVESDQGKKRKAVDAVISSRVRQLDKIIRLQNNMHITQELSPSSQGVRRLLGN